MQKVSLNWHSGCWKSTILNMVAGLNKPKIGFIGMHVNEITGQSLDLRLIFQNHSMLSMHSVTDNVPIAVKARKKSRMKEKSERK